MIETDGLSNLAGTEKLTSEGIVGGAATAWASLNGQGVIAARSSRNLSSVSDLGTGLWGFDFAHPFVAATFSCQATSGGANSAPYTCPTSPSESAGAGWYTISKAAAELVYPPAGATARADVGNMNLNIHGTLAP